MQQQAGDDGSSSRVAANADAARRNTEFVAEVVVSGEGFKELSWVDGFGGELCTARQVSIVRDERWTRRDRL